MHYAAIKVAILTSLSMIMLLDTALAQQPPGGMAKEAFTEILTAADKNQDGSLSLVECYLIWRNKSMGEQKCKFWDKNGDGTITEEEYVAQATSLMK